MNQTLSGKPGAVQDGYAPDVPEGAVFIAERYGEHPQFILTGERADSPILMCNTNQGVVTQVAGSVWEWMDSFAAGAEYFFFSGAGWEAGMRGGGRVEPGAAGDDVFRLPGGYWLLSISNTGCNSLSAM